MPAESENLYDDAPDSPPPATKSGEREGSGDEGDSTSILPRSFFHGKDLKPGDKCDVEVVAVHESDVEVKGCEGHGEDYGEEPPAAAAPQEGSMASLME